MATKRSVKISLAAGAFSFLAAYIFVLLHEIWINGPTDFLSFAAGLFAFLGSVTLMFGVWAPVFGTLIFGGSMSTPSGPPSSLEEKFKDSGVYFIFIIKDCRNGRAKSE